MGSSRFLDLVDERVVVYDGAFGTYMQQKDLTADDFGGPALEGCNEMLVLTRPELVAEMHDAYEVQAAGLLEGGVDVLLVETQFDLLGLKAAVIGCRRAMAAAGVEVPIQAQVTIEVTGRM